MTGHEIDTGGIFFEEFLYGRAKPPQVILVM
jgi:hypothetical protein